MSSNVRTALYLGALDPAPPPLHRRPDAVADLLPRLLVGVVDLAQAPVVGAQLLQELALRGAQLLVHLVPSDPRDVVALGVEEQVLEERLRALGRGQFARPELAVDVLESLLLGLDVILLEGVLDRRRVLEELADLVRAEPQRLEEDGDVLATLAVDANADRVLLVDVELQPGAPRRDDLRDEDVTVGCLVRLLAEVGARRADQLGDDDPLGAVDDEGAQVGHHGEVAEEDLLLLDLTRDLVDERRLHEQRGGKVLVPAFLSGTSSPGTRACRSTTGTAR